jgi:O-antigen ligase
MLHRDRQPRPITKPAGRPGRSSGGAAAVVALCIAAGWTAGTSPGRLAVALVAVLAVVAAGFLSFGRAVWCAAALVAMTAFGFTPEIATIGAIGIRAVDVVTGVLVVRAAAQRPRPEGLLRLHRLAIFVFIIGISVALIHGQPGFGDAAISWLRLTGTASLAWLVPAVVRSRRDLAVVLWALAAGGVGTVLYSAVTLGASDRAQGILGGPNSLGLVSGLIIVMSRYCPVPTQRMARAGIGLIGVTGLLLSKSIGSAAATGVALVVASALSSSNRPGSVFVRVVGRLGLAACIIFTFVAVLRPSDLPGSERFKNSSTALRLSVGYAGLTMFTDHPLVGVGWQQSGRPEKLRDPLLLEKVNERFADVRGYDDLQGEDADLITSVHNMYIQFLAETGLFGFLAFLWMAAGFVTGARAILRRVQDPWLAAVARYCSLALVLILVWWNDNPLFGGQVESILAFTFVGFLAAVSRLTASEALAVPQTEASVDERILVPAQV